MIGRMMKTCLESQSVFLTREISKMFNITSKYFCIVKNTPLACWVAHITRGFLTCYSCLYYGSRHLNPKATRSYSVKRFSGVCFCLGIWVALDSATSAEKNSCSVETGWGILTKLGVLLKVCVFLLEIVRRSGF